MGAGSEAKGVLAEIDALREELLGLFEPMDRTGDKWEAARIALDAKLLGIRVLVNGVVATWEAVRTGPFDEPGIDPELFEALEGLRESTAGTSGAVRAEHDKPVWVWAPRTEQERRVGPPVVLSATSLESLAVVFDGEATKAQKGVDYARSMLNRDHELMARAEAKTWERAAAMARRTE